VRRRRFITSVASCAALFLTLGAAFAAGAQTPVDRGGGADVDSVTVYAPLDVRITIAIGGDITPEQVVTSAPVGIRCGGATFQFTTSENRQCWLWVRRNQEVILTAQGRGAFGDAWNVVWSGCQPVAGGSACQLAPNRETVVAAVFSNKRP
jgi:hypothetical protein